MKLQFYILFIAMNVGSFAVAQNNPYEVKFSHQIESELADENIRPSRAGLLYSLIGDYYNSIQYSDIPVSWGVDTISLKHYSTDNALSRIIRQAQNHQIVIISENHLKPQHRNFADRVIVELSKKGFDHLGLETLTSIRNSNTLLDSALQERGYPLNSPRTGTYTLEPRMGNLVRHAIQSGLNMFAYERSQKIEGKDRDEILADNIIRYIRRNPKSRIIILCGFHHAIESDQLKRGNSFWMAKYLKDKLGVDPLTIYQDNFTEKLIEDEHPVINQLNIQEPSVFIDENGHIARLTPHVDVEVIHPKTTYIHNRPNWLFVEGYKAVQIDIKNMDLDFPVIVSAYPAHEVNSVPVDRVELKHKYDKKVLVLKPGTFRIEIKDSDSIHEYTEIVE